MEDAVLVAVFQNDRKLLCDSNRMEWSSKWSFQRLGIGPLPGDVGSSIRELTDN